MYSSNSPRGSKSRILLEWKGGRRIFGSRASTGRNGGGEDNYRCLKGPCLDRHDAHLMVALLDASLVDAKSVDTEMLSTCLNFMVAHEILEVLANAGNMLVQADCPPDFWRSPNVRNGCKGGAFSSEKT